MIPLERSIVWDDGVTEKIVVDENAIVRINSIQRNLFGMCISHRTPSGENVTGSNELAFYDKILTTLESRGVRLVQFELNPGVAVVNYTQILDMCRRHHMFVLALIAAWWFIPKTLSEPNFKISTSHGTVSNFFSNCCALLDKYPNVFSISADNEIDLRRSNVNGTCTYSAEAARDYMALITDVIRNYPWSRGCPVITTKIVTLPVSDTFRSVCRAYFLPMVDVLGLDTYPDTPAIETSTLSQMRSWANNQGYPSSRAFWQTEYSACQGGIEYKFTPAFLTVAIAGGSPINIAFGSFDKVTEIGFFNDDASPKTSLVNIFAQLPAIQGLDIPTDPLPEPDLSPVEDQPSGNPPQESTGKTASIGPLALFILFGVVLSKFFGRKKN